MEKKVFIQSNNKQLLGAKLAEFAIKEKTPDMQVFILNVDQIDIFKEFSGKKYYFKGSEKRTYNKNDLQSFTLSRFMPPENMGFEGLAVVIDPDIFSISNIKELFDLDLEGRAILACPKKEAWDSSVMLLDCQKLKHWKIKEILEDLASGKKEYYKQMTLQYDMGNISSLSRNWNSLDKLDKETKMLHTTRRLNQPWKTGLPIDFTENKMPKILGIIPRETIHKILGKTKTHYEKHPDPRIEEFFLDLTRRALSSDYLNKEFIQKEIDAGHVRKDLLQIL